MVYSLPVLMNIISNYYLYHSNVTESIQVWNTPLSSLTELIPPTAQHSFSFQIQASETQVQLLYSFSKTKVDSQLHSIIVTP